MEQVRIENLSKVYGSGPPAVSNVSLRIRPGEFVVLLGPSGCGKSTLLRMVTGLEEVSEGKIFLAERDVTDLAPGERDLAMVFQDYALYPHMTVRENLAFGLRMRKVARAEMERRIRKAAETLEIGSYLARKPAELSGGQRQRVAIARAWVKEPRVFLMDEPLSNLDARLRAQTRLEIAALHRRIGSTTIYVTHDQEEAMTLADRIVVMNRGSVMQVGTPQEIYEKPANRFVASFLGSPPMNFVERKGELLGVRPEDLRPVEEGRPAQGLRFAFVLEMEEYLGSEILWVGRCDSQRWICRVGLDRRGAMPGARILLEAPWEKVHHFVGNGDEKAA